MTSRQHQDWLNHGKPDSGLALPLQLLANNLSARGYVVYVYPNDAHLDAEPPEDHTYYSETGWPGVSPKWWRHAIDIMPNPLLPSLQAIGQALFNARQAGKITWLKYMNWPSDGNLNRAVQDRWEPNHQRGSSSDTGHIHLSSTTGCEVLDESFDPFTNVIVASAGGVVDMNLSDKVQNSGTPDHAGDRTLAEILADIAKFRAVLQGVLSPADGGFKTDSPLAKLMSMQQATVDVPALAASLKAAGVGQVDVQTLANALAAHIPSHITLTGTVS